MHAKLWIACNVRKLASTCFLPIYFQIWKVMKHGVEYCTVLQKQGNLHCIDFLQYDSYFSIHLDPVALLQRFLETSSKSIMHMSVKLPSIFLTFDTENTAAHQEEYGVRADTVGKTLSSTLDIDNLKNFRRLHRYCSSIFGYDSRQKYSPL